MNLFDYIEKHRAHLNVLEKAFVTNVFFPDYGDEGLELLKPQVPIYNDSTGENYYIDFVLETSTARYAIETDGLYYHAAGTVDKEYYSKLQRKQNETINQGYKVIRFTSTNIQHNPSDAIYELRRALIADPTMMNLRQGIADKIRPHEIQREALDALQITRQNGFNKGVVVFATGVGKTYLSAFDVLQMKSIKVLFIVHINEIIRQSRTSFEDVLFNRIDDMGFFFGNEKDTEKEILFASIQTIGKDKNITKFSPDHFDYIIIDETHHVAAPSYARIFEYFTPKFFLGLTATPDRMDKKDILSHFDKNLVYEIDQKTAIHKGLLVPYKYFGFKDDVDYSDIRWNGYRYNVNDLNKALMIERRDRSILSKFDEYCAGKKTIGFCVSIEHAEWMARLFNDNGIPAIAIHSQVNSEHHIELPKETKDRIQQFRDNKYQVAFVVNMFNEGVDIKDVESLLFLRPTESKTVFIQQMGRGLRTSPNTFKKDVIILDFIGNYKTATAILTGLGIGNLGNLKRNHEETQERETKLLYHYDNNGSEVYFQDEVVDVLRELKAKESKEVDHSLIDEEWDEYARFAQQASIDNLYMKIGQQNKHIPVQLHALKIIDQEPEISEEDFIKSMAMLTREKYPDTSMRAGFRGLMLSKVLGLADARHQPTSIFDEIKLKCVNDGYDSFDTYSDIITRQLEKLSYWNPIFGTFNKYKKQNERVRFNVFQNYPVLFINLVILELRDNYGYQDARLSKEEIEFFIVFAQTLADYKMVSELISRYRQYEEKPELRKMLKDATAKADSRIFGVLGYIEYYESSQQGIKISNHAINEFELRTKEVKDIVDEGRVITYEKNEDLYLKMLYSSSSFVDFHNNHQASS